MELPSKREIRSSVVSAWPTNSESALICLLNAAAFSPRRFRVCSSQALQRLQGWLDLPALPFPRHDAKHPPDILLGLKVLLALALADHAPHQAPPDQFPQILVRVAPADLQVLHHLVGRQGPVAGHQEGVDLGHGAIDPPGAAHRAPLGDKFITRGCERDRYFLCRSYFQ